MSPFSHRFPIQWPLQPPPPIPVAEMVAALSLASKRLRNVEESAKHPIETPNESGSKMNNMRNHNNCWRMDQFWGQYMGSVFFFSIFLVALRSASPTASSQKNNQQQPSQDTIDGRAWHLGWSLWVHEMVVLVSRHKTSMFPTIPLVGESPLCKIWVSQLGWWNSQKIKKCCKPPTR